MRSYSELADPGRSDLAAQVAAHARRVRERLRSVRACVAVMSGKGGVGKSFVAAGTAAAAAGEGRRTGLLDADLSSPCGARMSGVSVADLTVVPGGVEPARSPAGVAVMSMELVLESGAPLRWKAPEGSYAWRSAQERSALREMLGDVAWGELDLLVVDLPPGSDRLSDLADLVPTLEGVLAVTIPTVASEASVRRSLELARDRGLSILGVIENMAGYVCPDCGHAEALLPGSAGHELARAFDAPLLGRIPLDPAAGRLAEHGQMERLLAETVAGERLASIAAFLSGRA
ncbi:MAG: P-loop NTPase [Gemmatimonadota bacterium]